MRKKLFSVLLVVAMLLTLLSGIVYAVEYPTTTSNIHRQNYTVWSDTVYSYLYENGSGGLTRVEFIDPESDIIIENYNSDFLLWNRRSIAMELDIWGGFFAGETYNFLVFGQYNSDEDNNKEVIRVVKYSKDWERMGQASLKGANTTIPFRAGSLRFAEYNDELYIRTCHRMYTADDGLRHQANLSLVIQESDMTILDSFYGVSLPSVGYVSHSFNQFIIIDHQQHIVALDHGDANPRSAVLTLYNTKAGQGKIRGSVVNTSVQRFPGAYGDNTTGASLGGLAETTNGYVVVYNYDGEGNSNTSSNRKVYFAYVEKNSLYDYLDYDFSPKLNKDTDSKTVSFSLSAKELEHLVSVNIEMKAISSAGTTTPVLVPTSLDGGYILWNACDAYGYATDKLYYVAYFNGGEVGEVKTATASLSDCQPILYNGNVVWYTTDNTVPVFYQLDKSGNLLSNDSSGVGSSNLSETDDMPSDFTEPASSARFTDVPSNAYYADAVAWAVENGITTGTGGGKFSPDAMCTRAEIVTFLWRAAGLPTAVQNNRFADVPSGAYYQDAVAWAVENGITQGVNATTFSPGTACTRAQAVTLLHRANDSPAGNEGTRFVDVGPGVYYADAVQWAVQNEITNGMGAKQFQPDTACTRAQIVTFLYRDRTK